MWTANHLTTIRGRCDEGSTISSKNVCPFAIILFSTSLTFESSILRRYIHTMSAFEAYKEP
jgi:hypothetical protein